MNFRIEFLPIASDDLKEIDEYLSQFYESTPDKFFQSLHKKLELLSDSPYMYNEWEDERSLRKFVVGNYLVFYRISDECQILTIVRVIDGRGIVDPSDITLPTA